MKASSDISGFDSLRWDDQEKIRGKMDGGEGGGKGTQPANSVADDLLVEYAKSSRSKCKNCKEQIDKVRFDLWFATFIFN